MVGARTLASSDPQVWQLVEFARVGEPLWDSAKRTASESGEVAGMRGEAEASLEVWLL